MSKSTDPQSEPRQGDPRLSEFLRRASPILAAERGWNERSKLKIKSLAEDLKLPDDLYEVAVQRLQTGELRFEERFSVYEQSFIKFLHKQISSSDNSVLTAAHETKAIRIARRRFEIPQVRARQLVRRVAEQLGMSRVSKLDAEEYVAAIIDDQIGDATSVPDDIRGRIHEASGKWGVEPNQVEILIRNRIEANRHASIPNSPWKIRVVAAVLSLGFMLCMVWAAQKFFSGTMNTGTNFGDSDSGESGDLVRPVFVPAPRWWSSETAEQFRSFTAETRAARFPHEVLKSDLDTDRLIGYQRIVDLVTEQRGDFSNQCTRLYARFFLDESDSVCRKMSELILQVGAIPTGPLPSNVRRFSNAWRASDLLNACRQLPLTEQKMTLLDDVSVQLTGISIRQPNFVQLNKQAIAALHWQYLNTNSYSYPDRAARLIDPLGDLTRRELETPNPAEYTAVVSLLIVRPGVWNTMRRSLERVIETANDDQLRFLYLQKSKSRIPELQSWLGKRLAERLDIQTDRLTSRRIDEAIEKRLNLTASETGQIRLGWKRVRDNKTVQKLLNGSIDANPQSIGQAVHFATVAFLMTRANQTGDQSLIKKGDELLANGPRNLSVRTEELAKNLPVYRRIQRRALPSDIRTMENSLGKLSDPDAHSSQAKATAFEQLARAAPRLRDIPYERALKLARYMLEADEISELVAIEKYCSQMRHWPNLALAMADQITNSKGSIDQALTCATVLTGFQAQVTDENWRPVLRDLVLQRTALGLRHTAEVQGHDKRFQWNELRMLLMEHYRIRCVVNGVPASETSAANSPAELAQLFAQSLAGEDEIVRRSLSRKIEANRYLARNEMQLFVWHGKLLIRELHREVAEPAEPGPPHGVAQSLLENETEMLRHFLLDDLWPE